MTFLATQQYQRAALDAVSDAWVFLRAVCDAAGRVVDFTIVDVNAAAERLAGETRDELAGAALCDRFPMHRELGLLDAYRRVAQFGESIEEERYVESASGGEQWLHVIAVPIPDGLAIATRDISERRRAALSQARLAAILEQMPDIVAVTGVDGRVEYLNAAGRAMLGLTHHEASDMCYTITVADFQPQLLPGGALDSAPRRAVRDGIWRGETVLRKRDGREVPVEQVLIAHLDGAGQPRFYSSVMRDVTDRRQTEAALRSLSLVDELTGLYNRRGFLTIAEQTLQRARDRGAPVLVFYMDMDDFKRINDTHGHAIGDQALRAVADVLRATFRESDVIGRLGGDEFVAFAVHGVGMDPATIANAVTERIARRLETVTLVEDWPYTLRLSVGTARASNGADEQGAGVPALEALLADADAALYAEKCRRKAMRLVA